MLQVRQGALQGLAELLPALAKSAAPLPAPEAAALEDLVSRVEAARLLRGRGGELMRATVCRWASFLSLLNHARTLASVRRNVSLVGAAADASNA